jgi:hypothetical protein
MDAAEKLDNALKTALEDAVDDGMSREEMLVVIRRSFPSYGETIDLKRILMEVGNALVLNHRFKPAYSIIHQSVGRSVAHFRATDLLAALTDFFNASGEACEELEGLGLGWSLTPEQRASQGMSPFNV